MFRARYVAGVAGGSLAAAAFFGSPVLADSRAAPHLVDDAEFRRTVHEKKGNFEGAKWDLSELQALGEDGNCQGLVGPFRTFGIFDGHAGWVTSNHVANHVLDYLRDSYSAQQKAQTWDRGLLSSAENRSLSSAEVDNAILDAFSRLDNDILQRPLEALRKGDLKLAGSSLPLAASGACAMMAFYNPASSLLKVALTGDSRTVLGVQDADGTWHARNLTYDQTGATPSEIERIRAEHPNDNPNIVKDGRVLGFQPTRSFGDARTKYTRDEQTELRKKYWWRSPNPLLRTPPYMTAKPVISTVQLDPRKPAFMVMGCDGLYEWLTNAQVVELVGRWLDENPVIAAKAYKGIVDDSDDDSSKDYLRPVELKWGKLQPVVTDENASTHLIRNALGGAEFDKVSMLVSIPTPTARAYRDDITAQVVFFAPKREAKL